MREYTPSSTFVRKLRNNTPDATAWVTGNSAYPDLNGVVKFYRTPYEGILIEAEFFGLPNRAEAKSTDFYAMHIHENGDCTKPFDRTGDHFNPTGEPHPEHVGDLLPLFGNQGYAWMSYYNKRIRLPEIMGRSLIIHLMPDDFTSQPSGNAGPKIGCGVIR